MENKDKIIHAHVYKPHNALFKSCRNDRAECQIVKCNNYQNCELFKRKECCWIGGFGWNKCPYGSYSKTEGFTRKARKYYTWINEKTEQYKKVIGALNRASDVIAIIGDFIYLPYAHMTMNENIPFKSKTGLFNKGDCLLPLKEFTLENVSKICEFHPQAIFGGEIKSYQGEEIPKFIKHLSEKFPNLYKQLCDKLKRIKEISLTNIGRKAYLKTLNPFISEFVDCHKSTWKWDGEYLISTNSKASFMLIQKFSEIKIKPEENAVVTITDDNQINKDTIFFKS